MNLLVRVNLLDLDHHLYLALEQLEVCFQLLLFLLKVFLMKCNYHLHLNLLIILVHHLVLDLVN
tara:strand:- start:265 stop:456 length:192 start_codon:yes stop_codon:yes gene_type:complete